jgi:dTMP kinase
VSKNLFITVEGGEGVGKSTFITTLKQHIKSSGVGVTLTREPGGTPLADRIRSVFTDTPKNESFTIEAELMLVSAARAQHVSHKINPSLEAGNVVISDRFADSTRVYQGFLGGINETFLETVIDKTTFGVKPDITFLLDCDVKVSMARVIKRAEELGEEMSRFDEAKDDTHQMLRDGFLHYASKFSERFCILDASQSPEKVMSDALQVLSERFGYHV